MIFAFMRGLPHGQVKLSGDTYIQSKILKRLIHCESQGYECGRKVKNCPRPGNKLH